MGIGPFGFHGSSCSGGTVTRVPVDGSPTTQTVYPNPDPSNFSIVRQQEWKGQPWIVVEVVYPDATNFEGHKIMIYRTTVRKLWAQKRLDPHFCQHKKCLSPFARFVPTEAGWAAACAMADWLNMRSFGDKAEKEQASFWDRLQEDDDLPDDTG